MKSARERAEQAIEAVRIGRGAGTLSVVESLFKEHARDTLDAAATRLMSAIRGTSAPASGEQP